MITLRSSVLLIKYLFFILIIFNVSCIKQKKDNSFENANDLLPKLQVSKSNPHLLETVGGVPVFLNNYTSWKIIKNSSREDVIRILKTLKEQKFNAISAVLLNSNEKILYKNDTSFYGTLPFKYDSLGNPDPLLPAITVGDNLLIPGEYDYWDHVDYFINACNKNGIYVCLHPTWGKWVSGQYNGPAPGDDIVFNKLNAYKYGVWLGTRYGEKSNLIWMLGGDRSAQYEVNDSLYDYCKVWSAMAEGIADGINGENDYDGDANYSNSLMSYHPRKWAANSSVWFHNEKWLSFNSIQDTPYDQIASVLYDFCLIPTKPTWLFEGRYEGSTSAWAVRYQAYQTVLGGGFGNTYGSENWKFPPNWREYLLLPGVQQMAYLYTVVREIWSDDEFVDRIPDQSLIIGGQGSTRGDGMTIGDGDGGPDSEKKVNATSDRITAMRGNSGEWAIIYSANGRDLLLDMSQLSSGKIDAYWFNPRNGMWWVNDKEYSEPIAFNKGITTGTGSFMFDVPGTPGPNNDWVLVLK